MDAVLRHTGGHAAFATAFVFENPMPQGLTFHTPHTLFAGHYDVSPESSVEQRNASPFEPQSPKGKGGRMRNFALPA
jgi:hypothetical protein